MHAFNEQGSLLPWWQAKPRPADPCTGGVDARDPGAIFSFLTCANRAECGAEAGGCAGPARAAVLVSRGMHARRLRRELKRRQAGLCMRGRKPYGWDARTARGRIAMSGRCSSIILAAILIRGAEQKRLVVSRFGVSCGRSPPTHKLAIGYGTCVHIIRRCTTAWDSVGGKRRVRITVGNAGCMLGRTRHPCSSSTDPKLLLSMLPLNDDATLTSQSPKPRANFVLEAKDTLELAEWVCVKRRSSRLSPKRRKESWKPSDEEG